MKRLLDRVLLQSDPRQGGGNPREPEAAAVSPAFLCLAALVINHSLFALGALPPWSAPALTFGILAVAVLAAKVEIPRGELGRPGAGNIIIGIVALMPLMASLTLGWNRDFPFSGDHSVHISQAFHLAFWWLSPPGTPFVEILNADVAHALLSRPWSIAWSRLVFFVAFCIVTWRCYRWSPRFALAFATAALIAWGLLDHPGITLRYPAGEYFTALPFIGPAYALHNPELANRLAGVSAAIAWIWVLRPWLLRRWPDARILPVAALLLWHADVLYYLDSAYLEPWAFVFLLLAVEVVIARGRDGAALACLLTGFAAAVKEPAILALPFMWLAGAPWRGPLRRIANMTGAALAGGIPFLFYYAARLSEGDKRIVSFDFSFGRIAVDMAQYAHRLGIYYSGASVVPAICALAAIPILFWWKKGVRLPLACSVAAGFAIFLLFTLDKDSEYWTGYFRFFLLSLPFLAAGAVALGYGLPSRVTAVMGVVVLALNASSAEHAIALSSGPATDRDFFEHYEAPIVFPLKLIVAEAKKEGILPTDAVIQANRADRFVDPVAAARPGVQIDYGPVGKLYCECEPDRPYILALFIRYTNLNAPFAAHPPALGAFGPLPDRDQVWRQNLRERPACLAKMHQSCKHVIERVEGNEVVAALGSER